MLRLFNVDVALGLWNKNTVGRIKILIFEFSDDIVFTQLSRILVNNACEARRCSIVEFLHNVLSKDGLRWVVRSDIRCWVGSRSGHEDST